MSLHIAAPEGAVAERVLLPGDPLRARHIAERFLKDPILYNEIRGMYGFTGTCKGVPVSVQGTGMGMPSISIYAHELITAYGVRRLIRVGSCGAMQPHLNLRDVVIAMSASSDSNLNTHCLRGFSYAPTADFSLLVRAYDAARETGSVVHVGPILSSDLFYHDDDDSWRMWAEYGVLAVEMETAALYTMAAKHRAQALALLTVSDQIVRGEAVAPIDRQTTFDSMVEIALKVIVG
ncbi:purine-nucleoside phosphorylase [Candidatus Fermentibacteria bacterium]|nr:purine-nucleoside phosphorylase [Candidatus Fermentibacteria bacterium]